MEFFVWQRSCVDDAGNVLASASVSVTDVVSGALAQLYSDEGSTGIGNPITADSDGFVQFYVKAGLYNITATSGANSRTWDDEAIGNPHRRTAAEISASVTPVDYRYPEGHVLRYGQNTTPGTTDMATAIQNAINVIFEKGGGVAFLPIGTHLVESLIVMKSNVTLQGEGRGSIIKRVNATRMQAPNCSNICVRDLSLHGDPTDTTGAGISCTGMTDSLIHNVYVKDVGHDGILLIANCVGNRISNCHVDSTGDDGINIGGTLDPDSSTDNTVVGNVVENVTHDGVHVSWGSHRTTVTGNVLKDCDQGVGIVIAQNASIVGNVIQNCTTAGIRQYSPEDCPNMAVIGNNIEGCGLGISMKNTPHSTVQGNVIRDTTGQYGIEIRNDVLNAAADTTVSGNTIDGGCSEAGIRVLSVDGVVISDNTISGTGIDGIRVSAVTDSFCTNVTIANNLIRNPGTGSGVAVGEGVLGHHISILGNTVIGAGSAGIGYNAGSYFSISHNRCISCGQYGILLNPASSRAGRALIEGNTIQDGVTSYGISTANYDDVLIRSNVIFTVNAGIEVVSGNVVVEGNLTEETLTSGASGILTSEAPAATTPGTVTRKVQVFDKDGNSIGYIAVYDAIT